MSKYLHTFTFIGHLYCHKGNMANENAQASWKKVGEI